MKYGKKTLFRHGLALAIGFGVLCASSLAQDSTSAADGAASASMTAVAAVPVAAVQEQKASILQEKVRNYKVDIDLQGKRTRITDFVKLIQDQVPTPLNIVVSRDGSSLMIPPMRLDQVSVQAALNAAADATEDEMNWHFGEDYEVISVERDLGYGSDTSETIEVVNVSDILKDNEEASLLSAIEIGLELRGSSRDNVTIKLHKETRLLFIKGVFEDSKVVRQILSELGGKRKNAGGGVGGGGFGGGGGPVGGKANGG